jgi:RHS repeat-associated protein
MDRLITITDGLGNTINYTYDSSGNRLKEEIKDPQGVLTKTLSYQYDVVGRLWRINNPDSSFSEYGHDAAGNRVSDKDPNGNTTSYQYDGANRIESVIQPGSINTDYRYDSRNNLSHVTDANGNETAYIYDDMGRLYRVVSPDTGTTIYVHDAADNVITRTDARGITVNYQYDALNRLALTDFPTETDVVYTYDTCINGKGRLCQVQDQAGTTTYAYGSKGELVQEDRLLLGVNYVTGYQYDDNGNLDVLTYPSGRTVTYVYDNADQVTSVLTTPSGGVQQTVTSSISYYPFGPVALMTYGNGLVRTAAYDLQYRVTSTQTGAVQNLSYVHDPNENIQDIIDNSDSSNNKSFSYDALNRLEGATGPWGSLGWTYDNVGNRLTYTDAGGTTNYTYHTGTNRLQALTGATTANLTYDANGNTETEDTKQHGYSEDNRLISTTMGTVTAEYVYNADSERLISTSEGTSKVFHYDKDGQLLSVSLSDGTVLAEYLYLNQEPVAKPSGLDLNYIHSDHLGTPKIMTDGVGTKVWGIESRPFGDDENLDGNADLELRFPGQYHDSETGMNYNYFRYYMPQVGRYMTTDPLGLLVSPNLYTYVENEPIGNADASGLSLMPFPAPNYVCASGFAEAWRYARMVRQGRLPDKVGHCLAHCVVAKNCGPWVGAASSYVMDYGNEFADFVRGAATRAANRAGIPIPKRYQRYERMKWSRADQDANRHGRSCPSDKSCWERCKNAQTEFPEP